MCLKQTIYKACVNMVYTRFNFLWEETEGSSFISYEKGGYERLGMIEARVFSIYCIDAKVNVLCCTRRLLLLIIYIIYIYI